jgi:hypothetical protein
VTGFETTIDALDRTVERCSRNGDRIGYFAAMYCAVTRTIAARAAAGQFEDSERMARFVAGFADRYLGSIEARRRGDPVVGSWRLAFDAASSWRPVILQHLLLGMNAHINLDLGVTAAEHAIDGALDAVRADFDAVNDVLAALVDECQGALGDVSPWLNLADRIGGGGDETMIRFSLIAARRQAWSVATRLAPLGPDQRARQLAAVDDAAVRVGERVAHPGVAASAVLLLVRARERASPADVMKRLRSVTVGERR